MFLSEFLIQPEPKEQQQPSPHHSTLPKLKNPPLNKMLNLQHLLRPEPTHAPSLMSVDPLFASPLRADLVPLWWHGHSQAAAASSQQPMEVDEEEEAEAAFHQANTHPAAAAAADHLERRPLAAEAMDAVSCEILACAV